MADANQLLLRLERRAGQLAVECAVLHFGAHLITRQIGAKYRNACPHGRHHGGAVGFPWPALVVPLQGVFGLLLGRAGVQPGGGHAGVSHLQRHRSQ